MSIIGAAVIGGLLSMIAERTIFRKKATQIPIYISTTQQNVSNSSISPIENKINVNPCLDLYQYVCFVNKTKDPSGFVKRDAVGEVETLRIMEKIIQTHKKIAASKVYEQLVSEIYTNERVEILKNLFEEVRKKMLKFIDAQPFQALSLEERIVLKRQIERVVLELPPPASVYADEPNLYTSNDVYYERTNDGQLRIRIGGALLFTVNSKFNLAFTLAHELAHSFDPCELKYNNVDISAYHGLAECFGTPLVEQSGECKSHGRVSEIFSDWVATHIVADLLNESTEKYTISQTKGALMNAVRDLCVEDEPYDEDTTSKDRNDLETSDEFAASHPTSSYRVNHIFAQHPQIRKLLGCKENQGPLLPGVPQHCFWKLSTE